MPMSTRSSPGPISKLHAHKLMSNICLSREIASCLVRKNIDHALPSVKWNLRWRSLTFCFSSSIFTFSCSASLQSEARDSSDELAAILPAGCLPKSILIYANCLSGYFTMRMRMRCSFLDNKITRTGPATRARKELRLQLFLVISYFLYRFNNEFWHYKCYETQQFLW